MLSHRYSFETFLRAAISTFSVIFEIFLRNYLFECIRVYLLSSHIINGFYLNPNVHWWWPHETGDNFLLQDLEFVVANKVTHIINCAGKQIQNHWEPIGVAYLTFFWLDQDNQVSKTNSTNIHFEQSKPFSVVSLPSLHECRFYWTLEIRKTRPRTLSLNSLRRPSRPPSQSWCTQCEARVVPLAPSLATSCASTSGPSSRVSSF